MGEYLSWLKEDDTIQAHLLIFLVWPRGGGGYSNDVWVGRCGWGGQTLTLFKTEIFDFSTPFKTTSKYI